MKLPQGLFIVYQPQYRVPCVFDLHHRSLFRTRPFVTQNFGIRVLADENLKIKLQCAWLVQERTEGTGPGQVWDFAAKSCLLPLDMELNPDSRELTLAVPDEAMRSSIIKELAEWRTGYLPKEGDNRDLNTKVLSSIEEHKVRLRSRLIHKNHDWIMAGLPRRLQDFKFYIYPLVRDTLFTTYQSQGGESDEARLIRHIVLFNLIFDHDRSDQFKKLETGEFDPQDQAWECWAGFTGSEDEARRIACTMEMVFPPLAKQAAA